MSASMSKVSTDTLVWETRKAESFQFDDSYVLFRGTEETGIYIQDCSSYGQGCILNYFRRNAVVCLGVFPSLKKAKSSGVKFYKEGK